LTPIFQIKSFFRKSEMFHSNNFSLLNCLKAFFILLILTAAMPSNAKKISNHSVVALSQNQRFGAKSNQTSQSPTKSRSKDNEAEPSDKLYSFLAGGLAGSISSTITCPVEVVKTQLQCSNSRKTSPFSIARHIYSSEGPRGFFRGLTPTLIGIIPSRASYFWAYETTKNALIPKLGNGTLTHLISGLSAGIAGSSITNPIWMVKTRVQLLASTSHGQVAYTGYRHAIRSIFREEGIKGFYKGLSASYWGCSEGCIQFVVYEKIKKRLEERNAQFYLCSGKTRGNGRLPNHQYFLAAAFSKFVATVLTYPHEVVRTRLREQAKNGIFKYTGMWQSLILIGREEGRKGLYAGMGTHIARVVPNTAIMFLSYELINSYLIKRRVEINSKGKLEEKDF